MNSLFIDTSAFVALVSKRHRGHAAAVAYARQLSRRSRALVTSTYVLDETVTLVRRRAGHAVAVELGRRVLDSSWCRLVDVTEADWRRAWELFKRYEHQVLSLTDCTSFAVMESMSLEEVFTFDRTDFGAAGFVCRPAPDP